MKITKQRLKQIIKEEVQAKLENKAEKAAENVLSDIEDLLEKGITEAVKTRRPRRKKEEPKIRETTKQDPEKTYGMLQKILNFIRRRAEEEEASPEEVADLLDYKLEASKSFAKKLGVTALVASLLGGFATMLNSGLEQEQVARAMQRQEIVTQNIEYSGSREGKIAEFENYVNNTSAFRWGLGNQTMMSVPGSYEKRNGIPSQIDVLPPSYSIAIIALNHKMYGTPGMDGARGFFPPPDQIVNITDGNKEQAKNSLDNFFNEFPINSDGVYVNYSYIFDEERGLGMTGIINQVPSSGFSRRTVMINPDILLQKPDYVLPENGLTVQEYYNILYYGDYLSDAEAIELGIDR